MGAWGPGIFSDDVACDVRDTYKELLEDQMTDAEATARTLVEPEAAPRATVDGPSPDQLGGGPSCGGE